jgi:hypothetical protein
MWMFLSNFKKLIEQVKTTKYSFNNILAKFFKRIIMLIICTTLQKGEFKVFNIIMFKLRILNKNGKQYRLFKVILSKELKKFISEYDIDGGDDVMDSVMMLEEHFNFIDNKKKRFIQIEEGLAELSAKEEHLFDDDTFESQGYSDSFKRF